MNNEQVLDQNERDIILDKGLEEAWDRGFKHGVAWFLQQTTGEEDRDRDRIESILKTFEEQPLLKGITPIFYSLEE